MLDFHFKLFDVVLLVHFSMFCFEIVEEFELYKDTIRKRTKNQDAKTPKSVQEPGSPISYKI